MFVKNLTIFTCKYIFLKNDDVDFVLHRGITVGGICEFGASGDVILKLVIEGDERLTRNTCIYFSVDD